MTRLCQCGCGNAAPLARRSNGSRKVGDPMPFIAGHERRVREPQFGGGRMWVLTEQGQRTIARIEAERKAASHG